MPSTPEPSLLDLAAAAAASFGPALVLAIRRTRMALAMLLLLATLWFGVSAARAPDPVATIEVTYSFAAYVGSEVRPKAFVVDTCRAPSWQGPTAAALWTLLWAAVALVRRRGREPVQAFGLPLLYAWASCALVLGLQKLAGPLLLALGLGPASVPPFQLPLLAAALVAAHSLATTAKRIGPTILYLALFVALTHLPLAVFGTWATQHQLGTSLDVHQVDFIANPLNQMPTELVPGSSEQLAWLVWGPQLLIWPALDLLSAVGVGIALLMVARHREGTLKTG